MDKAIVVVEDVLTSLRMRDSVRQVYTEETDSPWNEKVLVKRKKDYLDVKITVWNENIYLYGRIYRLLLYIYDILSPSFNYDSKRAPKEDEAGVWELYSQIWGVYVDSRLERARIPNFYDRLLRRNLLAEALKEFEWRGALMIFDALWSRGSLTHSEIVRYAYDPRAVTLMGTSNPDALELKIRPFLKGHSVKKHLEKLTSDVVRGMAEEILNFTMYHCKDVLITSSYYGIHVGYKNATFAEMVVETGNLLLLTLCHPRTHRPTTVTVTETTDLQAVQSGIKEVFFVHFLDMQSI
ncbi:MAG: hypothetical protein ABSC55_09880 [Syntrophorhabdales bacterium]